MSHPLARVPILGSFVDERFLEHRRRASSIAGIATAVAALLVAYYRLVFRHMWSWDLIAVAGMFLVIKMSLFFWYRMHD